MFRDHLKTFATLLTAAIVFAGGCSGPAEKPLVKKQTEFPESRYLSAEGSGQTEIEARRQALAELSGIFESKVHAETTSFARAVIGPDNNELFEKNVESKLAVVSSVRLTGAQIGRVCQDTNSPGV